MSEITDEETPMGTEARTLDTSEHDGRAGGVGTCDAFFRLHGGTVAECNSRHRGRSFYKHSCGDIEFGFYVEWDDSAPFAGRRSHG